MCTIYYYYSSFIIQLLSYLQDYHPYLKHLTNGYPPSILYACEYCEQTFPVKKTLLDHKAMVHGAVPHAPSFSCDMCPGSFPNKHSLMMHRHKHTRMHTYKCERCNKPFSTLSSYKLHVAHHSEEDPYKCDECDQSYFKAFDLVVHKLAHGRLRSVQLQHEKKSGGKF